MATVIITEVSRCSGGSHVQFTATVNGVSGRVFNLASDDLLELPEGIDVREALLVRARSRILESGAVTPAQMRTALLNQTFKV